MKRHFQNYASAYLAGAFYFILQFALAFVAVGKGATPEIRANWHRFEWMMFRAQVLVMALPTILAFLDRSVANGRMAAKKLPATAAPVYLAPAPGAPAIDLGPEGIIRGAPSLDDPGPEISSKAETDFQIGRRAADEGRAFESLANPTASMRKGFDFGRPITPAKVDPPSAQA